MAKQPPSYSFYPSDFDLSTGHWSCHEVGIYIRLLNHQWERGAIPADLKRLSRIVREPYEDFKRAWDEAVSDKFEPFTDNHLANPRLERVRQEKLAYIDKQRSNGALGGRPPRQEKNDAIAARRQGQPKPKQNPTDNPSLNPGLNPGGNPNAKPEQSQTKPLQSSVSSLQSSDSGLQSSSGSSSSAKASSEPAAGVIAIPINDGGQYPVTQAQVDEWGELYPNVDVMQALRTIRGWNLSHPKKRKTRRGVLAHINSWLAREQDKGGAGPMTIRGGAYSRNQGAAEEAVKGMLGERYGA